MAIISPIIEIESLDANAQGVGRSESTTGEPGQVIFVEGALPGERVSYSSYRKKPKFEQAHLVTIWRKSAMRTVPRCRFFGCCGGCSMQHLALPAQIAIKQRVLEDQLSHVAKVRPHMVFRPIIGPAWAYRYRARLTVRNVVKKGGVLIGFHERKHRYVADMTACEVLPPHVSHLLIPLRQLVERLSICDCLPQIEVAVGDVITALVLRVLAPPNAADKALLYQFAQCHRVQFWLQPKGPDSIFPLDSSVPPAELAYSLPEFGIRMPFKPTDFTQVNPLINRVLVKRAIQLLAPKKNERILDLFCGIGNFTLPLARFASQVIGIEGNQQLTQRAVENARLNGVSDSASFACRNLFEISADDLYSLGAFDKWLIDPPRDGALAVVKALVQLAHWSATRDQACMQNWLPNRIVYVSCNPATLARDAGLLVHEAGYQLSGAGIINMFPHTSHVESIALFERKKER